jgi:hypothetical protein
MKGRYELGACVMEVTAYGGIITLDGHHELGIFIME